MDTTAATGSDVILKPSSAATHLPIATIRSPDPSLLQVLSSSSSSEFSIHCYCPQRTNAHGQEEGGPTLQACWHAWCHRADGIWRLSCSKPNNPKCSTTVSRGDFGQSMHTLSIIPSQICLYGFLSDLRVCCAELD